MRLRVKVPNVLVFRENLSNNLLPNKPELPKIKTLITVTNPKVPSYERNNSIISKQYLLFLIN